MFSDLRYAIRTLLQHKSFALVAILSIALGIGANAFVFSVADALVLRPLPVPRSSRVVNLRSQLRGQGPSTMSYLDFTDFRNRTRAFGGLAAMYLSQFGFSPNRQALPEMKGGLLVSGNFFDALEVTPQLGRGFRPDENSVPGRDAVARDQRRYLEKRVCLLARCHRTFRFREWNRVSESSVWHRKASAASTSSSAPLFTFSL